MAKCVFIFEDDSAGGMKVRVELEGFLGANKSGENNTIVHDLYFAISSFINDDIGLKLPVLVNNSDT